MDGDVKCDKCGHEISHVAESCPQCGHQQAKRNQLPWVYGVVLLLILGTPYLASVWSKKITPVESASSSKNIPAPQCGLIDGYQIGMSIHGLKEAYPKNLPAPSCRLSAPKMVRCDAQLEINNVPAWVSFDFGHGNDFVDGTQFAFGNGKLFGVKGNFDINQYQEMKQIFLGKYGTPKTVQNESTDGEGMAWNKDGNAITLSKISEGEGYLFSIIPLDPKRLSACLAVH